MTRSSLGTPSTSSFWSRAFSFMTGVSSGKLQEGIKNPITAGAATSEETITTEKALHLSVIWACLKVRSQIVASLPIHIRDQENKIYKDHPIYRLLHRRPNNLQTAYTFWQTMMFNLDCYGNSFAHIKKVGNTISLIIIDPDTVELERTKYGLKYFVDEEEISHEKILHFRGMSLDGLLGLSPITYMADIIGQARATGRAISYEFQNGLKVGGYLTTGEKVLKPDQRKILENALDSYARPENSGRWMILEDGQKAEYAKNPTAKDSQLVESRKQLVTEICGALGVHPSMIGYSFDGETWGGTIEQQNLQFLQYQLNPILVNIEQELEWKLLSLTEQDNISIKHSVEGLLRADSKTRAEIMISQTNNGHRTLNEVRYLDDYPPIDGGDVAVRQMQYQPIGTQEENIDTQNQPE